MNAKRRARSHLTVSEKATILELYDRDPRPTYEQIADAVGCSIQPVWRYCRKMRPKKKRAKVDAKGTSNEDS